MFAPAAFEDITFPQQSYLDWSRYEANQWCRAANAYFTTNNTAVYGAPTAMTAVGRPINHMILAENGKLYGAADAGSTTVSVINTYNDARSTITSTGNLATYTAFYSAFTKKVYLPGAGAMKVFNTLNDTYETSITYSAGGTFAFWWGTSYDGRYAYGCRLIGGTQMMKMDLMNNTISNTAVTSITGDAGNGTMGINGKMYFGCGGGSTAGIHCYNPFTDSMEYITVPGQSNVSDFYRDVVQHPNGYLYCFPAYGSSTIVRIDPTTNTAIIAATGVTDTRANNYALGADGKIYSVGNGVTTRMLNYNPVDNSVNYETLPSGDWQTILMGPNGDLHMFAGNGTYYKKILTNNGGTLRPLQEFNGIVSRLTGA
jgi:hypothetical protein